MTYPTITLAANLRVQVVPHPDGPLDGPISFTSSDQSIATLEPNGYITPASPAKPGTVTIGATGSSVGSPIAESLTVMVTQVPATTFGFTFAAPIPR